MLSARRRFEDTIYEQFSRIGKATSSPRRLELLDLLCQGPRTVEGLATQAGQTVANTSQHLQVLRAAGLVEAERDGQYVTYRPADPQVCEFFRALRRLAASRLAEVKCVIRDFLEHHGQAPGDGAALAAVIERVRMGQVTVLDVRPPEEYRAGHISGAISVPLSELERHVAQLSRDRDIVVYCRGAYCVVAVEAVETLRAHGFDAVRLADGVPEWRARGLPIETGDA